MSEVTLESKDGEKVPSEIVRELRPALEELVGAVGLLLSVDLQFRAGVKTNPRAINVAKHHFFAICLSFWEYTLYGFSAFSKKKIGDRHVVWQRADSDKQLQVDPGRISCSGPERSWPVTNTIGCEQTIASLLE